MTGVNSALRTPTAMVDISFKHPTDGDGYWLGRFWIHAIHQKCGGKEEFEFPGPDFELFNTF